MPHAPFRPLDDRPLDGETAQRLYADTRLQPTVECITRQLEAWLQGEHTPPSVIRQEAPRIGLFGGLGQGKSSVINLCLEKLQDEREKLAPLSWIKSRDWIFDPPIVRFDVSHFKAEDLEWRFLTAVLWQRIRHSSRCINLYGNSQRRMEGNVHLAQRTGANSANWLLLHGNLFQQDMDQNDDGFMDAPRTRRFNVMDRWMRRTERGMSQLGVRYVVDERIGGQTAMCMNDPEHAIHAGDPYVVDIRNELVDVFGKQGFIFKKDPSKSIGIMFAARRHDATSRFGRRTNTGAQESVYATAVYQMLVGKGSDQLKAGLSFQFDDFDEAFMDSTFIRTERMAGIFAEYTLQRNHLTMVAGVRGDANSYFGNTVSPRIHVKYDLGPLTNLRFSAGHGFRSANPLIESAAVLASSRRVVTEGRLGMERSWNFGASFLHKFKWLDQKWAFGVDVYRTEFLAQVVTDLDRHPRTVAVYMLNGRSMPTACSPMSR